MTAPACTEFSLLLQADHDGELGAADAARLAAHLATCPACRAEAESLRILSHRLRAEIPPATLPPGLAAKLGRRNRGFSVRSQTPGFAAGLAFAASLALFVMPRRPPDLAAAAVADHIRALQPGHLMDVLSTDRHTVKPWFAGKLDFSPPVQDFAGVGFPLKGGRLDYFAGRPVAALVYNRNLHVIDVLIWPGTAAPRAGTTNGYNYVSWTHAGMVFWAISDLNASELREFAKLWQ
ncbi:MAG TPA: zf-HC2 domain-containing protein [Acetobacteraceae bacterium]|nr:zf-HC2 domain-containing protein [Acetobacteraceae bacterium]